MIRSTKTHFTPWFTHPQAILGDFEAKKVFIDHKKCSTWLREVNKKELEIMVYKALNMDIYLTHMHWITSEGLY